MRPFIEVLFMLPVLILLYQFYAYAVSREKQKRQVACQALGIAYATLGIVCLVFRNAPMVFGGLFLIMLGLRLIASGLDRIDKKVFIDRYNEEE